MKQFKTALLVLAILAIGITPVAAQNNVYANNATFGKAYIYVMSPTFAISQTIVNVNNSCTNGRGVVVVSGILYYTCAATNVVFSYTLGTNTDNGPKFSVSGASALSTMAFDGANFWIGDYSGTNQAYLYTPTGTLLKTVHLVNCGGSCDGLEYFLQGGTTPRLISNRGDSVAPYDIYDTNGTLITAAFITTTFSATGIAFDGTNFLVSELNAGKIAKYNGGTGALISETAITGAVAPNTPLVEDLSVDYATTLPNTPAPSTLILMVVGLLAVLVTAGLLRRKTSQA